MDDDDEDRPRRKKKRKKKKRGNPLAVLAMFGPSMFVGLGRGNLKTCGIVGVFITCILGLFALREISFAVRASAQPEEITLDVRRSVVPAGFSGVVECLDDNFHVNHLMAMTVRRRFDEPAQIKIALRIAQRIDLTMTKVDAANDFRIQYGTDGEMVHSTHGRTLGKLEFPDPVEDVIDYHGNLSLVRLLSEPMKEFGDDAQIRCVVGIPFARVRMYQHYVLGNDLFCFLIEPLSSCGRMIVEPMKSLLNRSPAAFAYSSWSGRGFPSRSLLGMKRINNTEFGSTSDPRTFA